MPLPTPRVAPVTTATAPDRSGGVQTTRASYGPGLVAILDELIDWLRIPSISTGEGEPRELERAAGWVLERVRGAGGEADLVTVDGGHPLAVGELRAGEPGAPTVLIYGHYDVQSPGDVAAWTSPPFEPTVRDSRLYARGASDDKGNFLPLLHVACALARDGALPVNVRVLVEGEEEIGGESVARWLRADERGADAAIVFDAGGEEPDVPTVTEQGFDVAPLSIGGLYAPTGIPADVSMSSVTPLSDWMLRMCSASWKPSISGMWPSSRTRGIGLSLSTPWRSRYA